MTNLTHNYTAVLPVFNEEHRIESVLKGLSGHANILIIDNFSTDRTLEIAKRYTVEVVQKKNSGVINYEWYIEVFGLVTTDYILLINLAHLHTPALLNLYERIASSGRYKAVAMYLAAHCYGVRVNAWTRPFAVTQPVAFAFFDKRHIDLGKAKIHHELPFTGSASDIYFPPKRAEFCVLAFRDDDAESSDLKHTKYAKVDAMARYERGERTSSAKILAVFVWQFWLSWIWRGSIWQGAPGLITSIWFASYLGNVQIRIWELQKEYSRSKIVAMHAKLKNRYYGPEPGSSS